MKQFSLSIPSAWFDSPISHKWTREWEFSPADSRIVFACAEWEYAELNPQFAQDESLFLSFSRD